MEVLFKDQCSAEQFRMKADVLSENPEKIVVFVQSGQLGKYDEVDAKEVVLYESLSKMLQASNVGVIRLDLRSRHLEDTSEEATIQLNQQRIEQTFAWIRERYPLAARMMVGLSFGVRTILQMRDDFFKENNINWLILIGHPIFRTTAIAENIQELHLLYGSEDYTGIRGDDGAIEVWKPEEYAPYCLEQIKCDKGTKRLHLIENGDHFLETDEESFDRGVAKLSYIINNI